jgi:hypothetical protein
MADYEPRSAHHEGDLLSEDHTSYNVLLVYLPDSFKNGINLKVTAEDASSEGSHITENGDVTHLYTEAYREIDHENDLERAIAQFRKDLPDHSFNNVKK